MRDRQPRQSLSLVHRLRQPLVAGPAGERPPLLVLLHGIGSNELAMAALTEAFDDRFVIVSPRAPITIEPYAFAWFHMTYTDRHPRVELGEVESAWMLLEAFIDEAVEAYAADPERVFLVGFSQGSVPALGVLLTDPGRVAGVVCMSGWLPPELLDRAVAPSELQGKPVLIVHGREDATLPVWLGRGADAALRRLPLDLRYEEYDIGHSATPESLAVVAAWLSAHLGG